jgi:hypothetical protein
LAESKNEVANPRPQKTPRRSLLSQLVVATDTPAYFNSLPHGGVAGLGLKFKPDQQTESAKFPVLPSSNGIFSSPSSILPEMKVLAEEEPESANALAAGDLHSDDLISICSNDDHMDFSCDFKLTHAQPLSRSVVRDCNPFADEDHIIPPVNSTYAPVSNNLFKTKPSLKFRDQNFRSPISCPPSKFDALPKYSHLMLTTSRKNMLAHWNQKKPSVSSSFTRHKTLGMVRFPPIYQ